MSRRSPHIDFRIWFPLAAFSLFALVLPALADSGPCNCGNGKPCLANQMYFGYYPTVWRQWPGNCAEPQPANTAPGNQQIPNVEPPPPGQEFETRSFVPAGTSNTAPAPVPGSTPAPVPGGTGIEPFSPGIPAERERPGAVLPPPAVNPPAINPPLGLPSNDPQQLNQLLPTTSPQAFAPANEPNRIPAGNFPPISAYVEPSASIQGNWPPLNTVRAGDDSSSRTPGVIASRGADIRGAKAGERSELFVRRGGWPRGRWTETCRFSQTNVARIEPASSRGAATKAGDNRRSTNSVGTSSARAVAAGGTHVWVCCRALANGRCHPPVECSGGAAGFCPGGCAV